MSDRNITKATRLSVVIPCYNCEKTLATCLSSLLRGSHYTADEVLVVDDASSDNSVNIAKDIKVNTHHLKKNNGAGNARNIGAEHSHSGILFFIDSDIAIAPDAVGRIVDHFNDDNTLAAVIGSYDDNPLATNFASQYRNLLHHFTHQNSQANASHFWSGIGAIRLSVFNELGGFDQGKYSRAIEDVELGYRLRKNGYTILLDRAIQGKHLKRWSIWSMVYTDLFIRAIPWTLLLLEQKNMPSDFSLGFKQRASVATAWLIPLFLLMSIFIPGLWLLASICIFGFIWLNLPLFKLIHSKYGWLKGLASICLHWLHHFTSGLGFIFGTFKYGWQKLTLYIFSSRAEVHIKSHDDMEEEL
jgi:glycosyltransferase involved in cell wall biosynthesis